MTKTRTRVRGGVATCVSLCTLCNAVEEVSFGEEGEQDGVIVVPHSLPIVIHVHDIVVCASLWAFISPSDESDDMAAAPPPPSVAVAKHSKQDGVHVKIFSSALYLYTV